MPLAAMLKIGALSKHVLGCAQLTLAFQQWRDWLFGAKRQLWKAKIVGALNEHLGAVDGIAGLIGNTPLVRIRSLSELTGCEVSFL